MFSTEESFNEYLGSFDRTKEVPDIADRVTYNGKTYRVDGWYRAIPDIKPVPHTGDVKRRLASELGWKFGVEDREKRVEMKLVRAKPCAREDATHVALYSVGGAVVRYDKVEIIGKVNWSQQLISDEKASWAHIVADGGGSEIEVAA